MACESGTQAVFKTRLMLVGQDRVGKTSLKRTLFGLKLVSFRFIELTLSLEAIYSYFVSCVLISVVITREKIYT